MFLRQSTASQEILLGPFVDDTDGKTAETALTIANTDIKLWKGGTTTEANKNSGGGTHIAGGRYSAVLDATDSDTVGMLEINVHVTGALPVRRQFYILEEAVYDALFAASAAGYQVPIWASSGSTVNLSGTTVKTLTDAATITGDLSATMKTSVTTAATAATPIAASVTGAVGSVTGNVGGNVVGSVGSVTGNVGGSVASVVGAVGSVTGHTPQTGDSFALIGATGSGLTSLATAANLATIDDLLDTEVAAILAIVQKLDTALELNGGLYRFTIAALAQAPAGGGGGGLDAAGVRAAIGLASANLDTQLADIPTNAELAAALASSDDATLAAIAAEAIKTTAITALVDTLETEVGKVLKTGEQRTISRAGQTSITFTETRV